MHLWHNGPVALRTVPVAPDDATERESYLELLPKEYLDFHVLMLKDNICFINLL